MMNDGFDESELIQRAQQGDTTAFEPLVLRYKDLVFARIYRSVCDRSSAEELSQEVFVKAFRGIRGFRGDCKFSSWLTRIALHAVSTHRSSRGYREALRTEPGAQEISHSLDEGAEAVLLQRERVSVLGRCLGELSERLHAVMVLVALNGASYEEAAEAVQVPLGTVRSRLNQARLQLMTCFEKRLGKI